MDWDDLRHVLAVAREGTLMGASTAVGVARTTVARRIQALEEAIGTRLFHRSPDGLVPTPAGEELVAVAEQVEQQLAEAEARLRGHDQQLRGPLHVSTVPFVLSCFGGAFASFSARYPGIDLRVSTTSEIRPPGEPDADVVTRLSTAPPERLVGTRIGDVQFGVYAGAGLVERIGADAPLGAFPWIGRAGGDNVEWFEQWLATEAPGADVVMRLEYEPLLLSGLVREGIGAQILPCVLAEDDPQLLRIAPLDPAFRLPLWLLTAEELRRNSRVHSFIQHLTEAMVPHRARLAGGR